MTRGRPFLPGNTSGRGRPPGSRNKQTTTPKNLLNRYGDSLMRKAIGDALQGDAPTRRLLLNCLLNADSAPNRKLKNLPVRTAADIVTASATVVHEVTAGRLASEKGQKVQQLLESHRRAIETANLAERIARLESKS